MFAAIATSFLVLLISGQANSIAGNSQDPAPAVAMMGPRQLVLLNPVPKKTYVAPPQIFRQKHDQIQGTTALATSSIVVNFNGGGWTQAARDAFLFAANIWESQIESSVPIVVNANFAPMNPGVLGGAGPSQIWRDFPNAPLSGTWYPIAMANKLANQDLNPSLPDIEATFSSSYPSWYFGTDNNTPGNQINFATVVMHELGHGLGFVGSMRVDNGSGTVECTGVAGIGCYGYVGYPMIYDRFTQNGPGAPLLSFQNDSTVLADQLTSNAIYFDAPNARLANGGQRVPLYAPASWKAGSSYSHLAESYNGSENTLMTFSVSAGETIYHPGNVALGLFKDMGWSVVIPPPPPPIRNGDFEQGREFWTDASFSFPYLIVHEDELISNNRLARSLDGGEWVAWLGGGNNETSILSQVIEIPENETYLHYWQWIDSFEDTCDSSIDGAFVLIDPGDGEVAEHSYPLCSRENTAGWVEVVVDLAIYSNTEVTLTFKVITNGDQYSDLFLDKVFLAFYPLLEEKTYLPLIDRS